MESQEQLQSPEKEAQDYSVPWKPVDNWIGILLLLLINVALLYFAVQGIGTQLAQSAGLILLELAYLAPVLVVFAYRRINPAAIGFRTFKWSTLGLGCGLVIGAYIIIFIHNSILLMLGIETQGQEIFGVLDALDSPFWFILVGVVFAPIVEEIFFRGFLFQGFRQRYGVVAGGLLSAAIFASAHLSLVVFIPTFLLGCVLAYMYHRTNSVLPGIILHFIINGFGFLVIYAANLLPQLIPS